MKMWGSRQPTALNLSLIHISQRRAGAYSQKGKVSNLKEMNETFNYLRANDIYSLEDLEHRVSEHSACLLYTSVFVHQGHEPHGS